MEDSEVDLSLLLVELGMLVVESRLPTASVKGRQDGPHCPRGIGDWPSHVCDVGQTLVSQLMGDV